MGQRGNIVCIDQGKRIYLYTHWGGYRTALVVWHAFHDYKGRLNDEAYMQRILLSQLVGEDWSSETGYGLTTYLTDYENPSIYVDFDTKTITIRKEQRTFLEDSAIEEGPYTFEQFMELPEEYVARMVDY